MKKQWFKVFSSCVLVKGHKESLIYDLERNCSYAIGNAFLPYFEEIQDMDLPSLEKKFPSNYEDIKSFMEKFLNEEIAFITHEPANFPEIDFTWKSPYIIENAVIEIARDISFDFQNLVKQLDDCGCQAVELRFQNDVNSDKFKEILKEFRGRRFRCIDIIIPYNLFAAIDKPANLYKKHPRIRFLKVYGVPSKIHNSLTSKENGRIIFSVKEVNSNSKESIRPNSFVFNIPSFAESQNHNLGLNRKISISKTGSLKNFLNHEKSFGNIKDFDIKEVISTEAFNKIWYLSNDQIEKCKDCQYRYACVNNSDIKEENGKSYRTDDCGFNPYRNKWTF